MIVLASSAAIAGGYIINNFYDREKDLINRPHKTMLDRLVSQRTKLTTYFILNFFSVIFASYVSFRAVLFFSIYIFAIWYYSHRLKRYPFVGNITAAILAVIPFFAVFIYYKNFDLVIFVHATFLFLVISMRELVKDLENIKGDFAQNYRTIPVVYGEKTSKRMLTLLSILTLVPIYFLLTRFDLGFMHYYFYGSILALVMFLVFLWMSARKLHYILLHTILKLVIVIGVFSIVLIDVDVLLNRIL
jgi:4-hydroxybenzoate polyprenyltransferase